MCIRTTIVGCGAVIHQIYKRPLQTLQKQGDLIVSGLVDSNPVHAKSLLPFFQKASVYDDLDIAISQENPELTIVSSPPFLHVQHTIAALEKGSHVLCEKPLAKTLSECQKMIDAAKLSNRILAVEMTRRNFPSLRYLKRLIDGGEMKGRINFSYREGAQYAWPIMTSEGFSREGGGGILMDIGSHVLDAIKWLFGPLSIESYRDDAFADGIESDCILEVRTPRVKGYVQLSWIQPLNSQFRVKSENMEIIITPWSLDEMSVFHSDVQKPVVFEETFPRSAKSKESVGGIPKTYNDCVYYQIVQVLRAIRYGEDVPVKAEEGAETISIMEKCYAIAESIDMTWLPKSQANMNKIKHWRNPK